MEGLSTEGYRDELAKKITSSPKAERPEILNQSKETVQYWQSRKETIAQRQDEAEVDGGLGIFIKKKTLYHGSYISGIKTFKKAMDSTIAQGLYLTSEAENAAGYAQIRADNSKENWQPFIYESTIENMRILDFRKTENVTLVLNKFMEDFRNKTFKGDKPAPFKSVDWYEDSIRLLEKNIITSGNVKLITDSQQIAFTNYVKGLGYDGLVTYEGGEGGKYGVGNHDSYVIFEPEKVKISHEHHLEKQYPKAA